MGLEARESSAARNTNQSAIPTDADVMVNSIVDPASFGILFDRHASTIYGYLARRLGPSIAEDLLSETFAAAFRRRHGYDPAFADARPWLYGIASNVIAQHRRQEARRWHLEKLLTKVDETREENWDDVDARVTAAAQVPLLAKAIAGLKPGDRDVLLLIAWEDLTYEQVAVALGIPVGTVRSRLHRARRQLKPHLAHSTLDVATLPTPKELNENG